MFEKTLGGGSVQVLAMMQVIVYLLLVKQFRATFVMKGEMGETAKVVP